MAQGNAGGRPLPPLGSFVQVWGKNDGKPGYHKTWQRVDKMSAGALQRASRNGLNGPRRGVGGTTPRPGSNLPDGHMDDTGFFFNPWSDTLWSRRVGTRNADGTISYNTIMNAGAPARDGRLLKNMDLVSQYRLPTAGAGNLIGGVGLNDASYFMNQMGMRQNLINSLMPYQSKLAELNREIAPGRTRYDIERESFLNSWDDQKNAAMGNLATRGIYSSGMRNNASAKLAEAYGNGLLSVDSQWGGLKKSELQSGMEDARKQWAMDVFQSLLGNVNMKNRNDLAEEFGPV